MSDRATIIEALLAVAHEAEDARNGWLAREADTAHMDHAMDKLDTALGRLAAARKDANGAQCV